MRTDGWVAAFLLAGSCATSSPPARMDATMLKVDMSAPRPDFEAWKTDYVRRLETASRVIETRIGPVGDVLGGIPDATHRN
jgi:hypothetical protein